MIQVAFTPQKTGRKNLALAIAAHLGAEATYQGAPSFAYQIGQAILDRDWILHLPEGTDQEGVLAAAQQAGFSAPEDGEIALTVTMPTTGWSERTRANLEALLASKGPLIAKALGIPTTPLRFQDDQTVAFPWFSSIAPDLAREVVLPLVAGLCQRAKEATRINPAPPCSRQRQVHDALLPAVLRVHRP